MLLLLGAIFCLFSMEASARNDEEPDFTEMINLNCSPSGESRCPDLYIVYQPDVLTSSKQNAEFACSHGSPWESDTRIPLILFGGGIRKGVVIDDGASLEDITPTLAELLGAKAPENSNGRILLEALKGNRKQSRKKRRKSEEDKVMFKEPRATLVFTLDQARADYLTNPKIRNALRFTRKVLLKQGVYYPNARLSYAGSRTAVSHAVIGTGATPGVNGIIGNNIGLDDSFPLAFNDDPRHSMNPDYLLAPSFADVFDLERNNAPIVISMSPYGRAALGMGGHGASFAQGSDRDIVLKLSSDTGLPYTNGDLFNLPASMRFSGSNPIRINQWLKANYGIDMESDSWTESTVVEDNGPYAVPGANVVMGAQGRFADGSNFEFSHPIVDIAKTPPDSDYQLWSENEPYPSNSYFGPAMNTPFYQLWAVDMLLKTMEAEGVGGDRISDLVFYNFKCLDKVGHKYGVNSPEVYSYLFYLDYCLRKINYWLDRNVGRGNYVLAVTADHGAHNSYGDRILFSGDLFDAIEGRFGENIILNDPSEGKPFDDMIYLDGDLLAASGSSVEDVAEFVEAGFPEHVYRVYARDAASAGQ